MFLEPLTGYSRCVCLNETGWSSDLFIHKFFAHASALKHLKSRALVHGEIAIIPFFFYLPIKGKHRELHPNIILLLNTDEMALKGWRISTKTE